MPFKVIQGN